MKLISLSKKAQEEMVGFALILIILAVVLVIFLSFSQNKSERDPIESFKATSFVQSILDYTTDCGIYYESDYASVRELLRECSKDKDCYDERPACEVLNQTIFEILDVSWKVGLEYPEKGYVLNITERGEEMLSFFQGNVTRQSRGTNQELVDFDIRFIAYS